MGVFGDWENPYKTMNFQTEANTIRVLSEIYNKNFLIQGFKPVFWCLDCKSALADAEVEYSDIFSKSIYVKFKIQSADILHLKNQISEYLMTKKFLLLYGLQRHGQYQLTKQ